jgi:hypothetical protein
MKTIIMQIITARGASAIMANSETNKRDLLFGAVEMATRDGRHRRATSRMRARRLRQGDRRERRHDSETDGKNAKHFE